MKRSLATAIALVLALAGCTAPPTDPELEPGRWRAWLDSPGGELPFGLELSAGEAGWTAAILNGEERLTIERVTVAGSAVALDIDHFDAHIEATIDSSTRLTGRWWKTGKLGAISELPFHAVHGETQRFSALAGETDGAGVEGRWSVRFAGEEDEAVAEFASGAGNRVTGTFLTTTGDYRFLAGSFEGRRLRLSTFDGAHAFLFDAELGDDGTLTGDFWSRESWHDTWTATRAPEVALDAATEQIAWVGGVPLSEIVYPDLDGNPRALDDAAFAGKARVLEVFGSWCPNCNDATSYLVDLHERYRERGLSIVGLAFELTGDFDRDAKQLRIYRDHHGIEYPLLVAGTSDKDEASAVFPLIERVKSYPTTIFLHADGRVHTVYSGFSGPATGDAHERLKEQFERTIEELLGEE